MPCFRSGSSGIQVLHVLVDALQFVVWHALVEALSLVACHALAEDARKKRKNEETRSLMPQTLVTARALPIPRSALPFFPSNGSS